MLNFFTQKKNKQDEQLPFMYFYDIQNKKPDEFIKKPLDSTSTSTTASAPPISSDSSSAPPISSDSSSAPPISSDSAPPISSDSAPPIISTSSDEYKSNSDVITPPFSSSESKLDDESTTSSLGGPFSST
jgi:hypothetical protein